MVSLGDRVDREIQPLYRHGDGEAGQDEGDGGEPERLSPQHPRGKPPLAREGDQGEPDKEERDAARSRDERPNYERREDQHPPDDVLND